MGEQSSRIIWGKNKNPGGNDPTPVGLYNGNDYIYCSGNYSIHSDGRGRVAEDYHLYICTATETGGAWVAEDWKIINGVKNYYLIDYRSFKKGAKVIKEDHNGDFETLKLYTCIVDQSTPYRWKEEEWEVVYQEVGIAWIPRDHKEVYYDDGKNKNKWHKLMYFVPEYFDDQKEDLEISEFTEYRTYHYGDRAIHRTLVGETYCYTYDDNIPRRGEWAAGWWSLDEGVEMYETYRSYSKGDQVIKKNIEAGLQVIQEYGEEMSFESGKYCIHKIDRKHDVHAIAGFHDVDYILRLFGEVAIMGLYKSNKPTYGEFNQDDWDLQTSEIVQVRGRDYNKIERENPDPPPEYIYVQKDIKEYEPGRAYEVNELCIYTYEEGSSVYGLMRCIKPTPEYIPSESSRTFVPPASEYWEPVVQFVEEMNSLRVFEATVDMDASINTHFIRENWKIVSQLVEPDYDLYGVIWEKYGHTNGTGCPYFAPLLMWSACDFATYDGLINNIIRKDTSIDNFYPFMGDNALEIGKSITGDFRYVESGQEKTVDSGYPIDTLINNGFKIYGIYSASFHGDGKPHGFVCGVFNNWHTFADNVSYLPETFAPTIYGVFIENTEYLIGAEGDSVVGTRQLYAINIGAGKQYQTVDDFIQNATVHDKEFTNTRSIDVKGYINGASQDICHEKVVISGNPGNTTSGYQKSHNGISGNYWTDVNTDISYASNGRVCFIFGEETIIELPLNSFKDYNGTLSEGALKDEFDSVDQGFLIDDSQGRIVWYQYTTSFNDMAPELQAMYNEQASEYGYVGGMTTLTDTHGNPHDAWVVLCPYTYRTIPDQPIPGFLVDRISSQAQRITISNTEGDEIYIVSTYHTYWQNTQDDNHYYGWLKLTVVTPTGYQSYEIEPLNYIGTEDPYETIYIHNDANELWFIKPANGLESLYKISLSDGSIISKTSSANFYLENIQYRGGEDGIIRLMNSQGRLFDLVAPNGITIRFVSGKEPIIYADVETTSQSPLVLTMTTLYVPLLAFYRQPWCGLTGAPIGRPDGLYISGWLFYRENPLLGGTCIGSVGICLPRFPRNMTMARLIGFYWINSDYNKSAGTNIYGGTIHNGFEGW